MAGFENVEIRQGFGFYTERQEMKGLLLGRITRLACTKPGTRPEVG
jgi:hypothetical protein